MSQPPSAGEATRAIEIVGMLRSALDGVVEPYGFIWNDTVPPLDARIRGLEVRRLASSRGGRHLPRPWPQRHKTVMTAVMLYEASVTRLRFTAPRLAAFWPDDQEDSAELWIKCDLSMNDFQVDLGPMSLMSDTGEWGGSWDSIVAELADRNLDSHERTRLVASLVNVVLEAAR